MALQLRQSAASSVCSRSRPATCTPVTFAQPLRHAPEHQHRTGGASSPMAHPHPLRRVQMSPRGSYLMVHSDNYGGAAPGDARIKVLGVGGGGGNALHRMINSGMQGVEFWAVNTDAQALAHHSARNKLQIGTELTRGLGCGGNPEMGRAAALESQDALKKMVAGADLVFVTAGMGGGTGTGAAPMVAKASKDSGILTIGVVTCPFSFEGRRRRQQALQGVLALRECVDSVIIIPNDKLREVADAGTSLTDAFTLADEVLRQGVQGISDIITVPGLINVDFADVRAIMSNAGTAMLGMGAASGEDRAEEAALAAVSGPLIQESVQSATGIVFNITGGQDLTLSEVNRVSEVVMDLAHPSANVIFGAVVDERYSGELQVTLIATGFDSNYEETLLGNTASGGSRRRRSTPAAASSSTSSSSSNEEGTAEGPRQAAAAAAGGRRGSVPRVREGAAVGSPAGQQGAGGAPLRRAAGGSRGGQEGQLPWRTTRSYTGRPLL